MQPNQICILTGSTGGIGQAIAKLLDKNGVKLILHGRDQVKLNEINNSLTREHQTICGDLNIANDRTALIEASFSDSLNQPTLLINNAGISQFKAFEGSSTTEIERIISLNLIATIDFTLLFLKRAKQSSTIVNVGSAFGAIGYPGYTLYCASKFGLRGFTEALHREFSSKEHRICYFAPRATDTPINSSNVKHMNNALGNKSDTPSFVAKELWELIEGRDSRKSVGWPEKLFARINGILPEFVDKAITSKTKDILTYAKGEQA